MRLEPVSQSFRVPGLAALAVAVLISGCGESGGPPAEQSAAPAGADAPAATPEPAGADYDIDALVASADVKRGQTLFLQCRACHSLAEGEPHKVGPNLWGMFGRKAGLAPGFAYSEAVSGSGIEWSAATLNEWLARPSDFLPGNRMVFIGVKEPQDRANLIAYLKQETGAN